MRRPSLETITLVIGIVAIVVLISIYDINGTFNSISRLDPFYLLMSLVMFVVYSSAKFLPWTYVLHKSKMRIPVMKSMIMMFGFFGLAVVPTSIAQYFPLRYLDKFKKDARFLSVGISLALGATGVLSLILVTLVLGIMLSKYIAYLIALFAILYSMVSLMGFKRVNKRLPALFNKILNPKKHKVFVSIPKYIETLRKHQAFLSQKEILSEMLLFVPSIVAEGMMLVFILFALGQTSISVIGILFVYGISLILGNMSMLPGGIGVTESSLAALLLINGIPGAIAIIAIIIFRFLNVVVVFVSGYVSLFYLKLKMGNIKTSKR